MYDRVHDSSLRLNVLPPHLMLSDNARVNASVFNTPPPRNQKETEGFQCGLAIKPHHRQWDRTKRGPNRSRSKASAGEDARQLIWSPTMRLPGSRSQVNDQSWLFAVRRMRISRRTYVARNRQECRCYARKPAGVPVLRAQPECAASSVNPTPFRQCDL